MHSGGVFNSNNPGTLCLDFNTFTNRMGAHSVSSNTEILVATSDSNPSGGYYVGNKSLTIKLTAY